MEPEKTGTPFTNIKVKPYPKYIVFFRVGPIPASLDQTMGPYGVFRRAPNAFEWGESKKRPGEEMLVMEIQAVGETQEIRPDTFFAGHRDAPKPAPMTASDYHAAAAVATQAPGPTLGDIADYDSKLALLREAFEAALRTVVPLLSRGRG